MAKKARIRPEQIARVQKLLQDLPEKDVRKTRTAAAKILEKDFKKAFQKGYSPKEIASLLKNAGVLIPAYVLKEFLTPENKKTWKAVPEPTAEKLSGVTKFTVTPDTSDEEL